MLNRADENRKIEISADDFGISLAANRNIFELAKQNKLSRISIIVDGQISAEDVDELKKLPVKLDIHLYAMGKMGDGRKLKESVMMRLIKFLFNFSQLRAINIRKQWEGQLEKFNTMFGKEPDGINSHQYVHFYPSYFVIALELAKENQIQYVRFGRKGLLESFNKVAVILNLLRMVNLSKLKKSAIKSSDYFVSLDWIKDIKLFQEKIPNGLIEIGCHPERLEELTVLLDDF